MTCQRSAVIQAFDSVIRPNASLFGGGGSGLVHALSGTGMHFDLSGAGRVVDATGWVESAIYTLNERVGVL